MSRLNPGGRNEEVCAFETKNKLDQLLDFIEQGEEIVITRHGKEVARLVPARQGFDREQARAAVRRIVLDSSVMPAWISSACAFTRRSLPQGSRGRVHLTWRRLALAQSRRFCVAR